METTVSKNKDGYGYKYTDLAQIHEYLEKNNMKYYQYIKRIEQDDYIMTRRCIENVWEQEPIQGCRVVDAVLNGIKNPAQEQGSAITYARRYSLLMAFGLATEDDDAQCLTQKKESPKASSKQIDMIESLYTDEEMEKICNHYKIKQIEDLNIQDASSLISKRMK